MVIAGYKDITFSSAIDGEGIKLQFNPEELSYSYSIESPDSNNAAGESSPSPVNRDLPSSDFEVSTLVDASGVVPYQDLNLDPAGDGVMPFIEKLKKNVYYYIDDTHAPPYVKITWGKVTESTDARTCYKAFHGRLKELKIVFNMFSMSGVPIRAKIDMTFEWVEDPTNRPTGQSPDLTHFIEIEHGDNLPALCNRIYKDPSFFMQVAKVNNLSSVYELEPGSRLIFPPLDKASR